MGWPETRNSLIRRLADPADAAAWEEFERSYQPAIYRFVRGRGLPPEDAIDAVQEVLLAVHRRAASWQPSGRSGSFRTWLGETARRVTLQQLRWRARVGVGGTTVLQQLQDLPAPTDSAALTDEWRWRFYCAAATVELQVSPVHWRAFWLTAVEGNSAEQVASQLGLKIGTVYSIRCRIQARIHEQIRRTEATQ